MSASRSPDDYRYQIQGSLQLQEDVVALAHQKAGRLVLATNVVEDEFLSDAEMLSEYKQQQSTEQCFRFLKDPMFFTQSVFGKTPRRIEALAMVMALCLLVSTGTKNLTTSFS